MNEGHVDIPYMGGKTPNRSQIAFAGYRQECRERYYLGTPACGKTSALIAEVNRYSQQYPGSAWLLARYTELEAASVLKGDFEAETPRALLERWDHDERCYYYRNGSKVYIHGLKPAEGQGEFSKFAGYNLSGVAISQVEVLPEGYADALKDRLRHKNPPRYFCAEGNFTFGQDHWLYPLLVSGKVEKERVCRDCGVKVPWIVVHGQRVMVTGGLDDNEANLPADFQDIRLRFPPGHPEHTARIAGWVGIVVKGQPVYVGLFNPHLHVGDIGVDVEAPVLEAWDFGITHPAVTWSQLLKYGRFQVLGEYMGSGVMLEDALSEVRRLRNLWFGKAKAFWVTADPAGEARKDTGKSSIQYLRERGLPIAPAVGGNTPAIRLWAIQQMGRLMGHRVSVDGQSREAFGIHPRCKNLIDGFVGGYVKSPSRNDGLPLKDGWYDHLQNGLEYTLTAFWSQKGVSMIQDRKLPQIRQPAWR